MSDVPLSWPPSPEVHIVRKKDLPVRPGMIALCGAKLLGVDLKGQRPTCKKCIEVAGKELSTLD